jgi:DNA-binding CsgD family transcriptional regulator
MQVIDGARASVIGRGPELERLGSLAAGARNGHGAALLIRGEPGIGKTVLLSEFSRAASGARVLRADGFEAESEMPYATLQRLGRPLAAHLDALLPTHSTALRIAAGIAEGPPPDRYLVAMGMLSLLAAAGEDTPITCVVDDAHLVDAESLEVLAFVARRLEAERVLLILASRPDTRVDLVAAGVPILDVEGLDPLLAVQLLNTTAPVPLDPLLATRIAEQTGGNPLALVELARDVAASRLTSSWVAQEPIPVGSRLEAHYLQRIETLPEDSRQWLLVAAAESTGDIALITSAAARLGLAEDASVAVELAELATVHDSVLFRHSLVRSVVYNTAPDAQRRRAHDALRAEADAVGRGDVAVWHAAGAALGPDEDIASRLERAAESAGVRGGSASRARLLARAAELTPAGPARGMRLLTAAESAAQAGAAGLALDLIGRIEIDDLDPVSAGRMLQLQTLVALFVADRDRILTGSAQMLRAAELFHGVVPPLEQRALIRAFEMILMAEWAAEDVTLAELGRRLAAGAEVADGPMSSILRGLSAHILLPYDQAVPHMRHALEALYALDEADVFENGTVAVALSMALWDERSCVELLERSLRASRERGRLREVDSSLWLLGLIELVRGDPAASERYVEQVRELRRAIGYDAEQVVNAASLAWAGVPTARVEMIAQAVLSTGFVGAFTIAMTGLSIREIADGHYRDAYRRLRPMIERPFLQVTYQQLPDFVEAGVRSGNADDVRASAERLAEFAAHSATPWIRGLSARSAALLAEDDRAEALYIDAIAQLSASTAVADLGRAHLVYGEWLRRAKRRHDAREHLHAALSVFERCQAPAFAARARRELEATGLSPGVDAPRSADDLTSQEAAVARLAAAGQTNPEIGAALFISVNTVDYHLRKVFRKLGVTSRRQLAQRLATD